MLDLRSNKFFILTLVIAIESSVVQSLWTPVEGLVEYFKDTNGGDLRLKLSLDNLG